MGWTVFDSMPRGGMKAAVDAAIRPTKIVESAIASDGNYYAALELPKADGSVEVIAAVGLIEGAGYKLMSEAEGPYYYACPATILAKLTPTQHPFALKWRARCEQRMPTVDRRIDGFNVEFLGAKPARAGEDY